MNKQTESIPQGWIEHLKTKSVYLNLLLHTHTHRRQPNRLHMAFHHNPKHPSDRSTNAERLQLRNTDVDS